MSDDVSGVTRVCNVDVCKDAVFLFVEREGNRNSMPVFTLSKEQ